MFKFEKLLNPQTICSVFLTVMSLVSCRTDSDKKAISAEYSTVSYLSLKLDEHGRLASNPFVKHFKKGKKEILFCGVNHSSDPTNTLDSMYSKIESEFLNFRPQVAVNEGGDVSRRIYATREQAILEDGEIGLTKILCDQTKITTLNGDPMESFEFSELQKTYSTAEVLCYIVTERLMWGIKNSKDTSHVAMMFDEFLKNYLVKRGGLKLNSEEQSFLFFKEQYQSMLGRSFSFAELEPTNPFDANSRFQEIGRRSKEIRDQYLMKTIDGLLNTYDRVIVVFGGWHLLVCTPGLNEIINKERK